MQLWIAVTLAGAALFGATPSSAWVNPLRSPTDADPEIGPLFRKRGSQNIGIYESAPSSPLHIGGGAGLTLDGAAAIPTHLRSISASGGINDIVISDNDAYIGFNYAFSSLGYVSDYPTASQIIGGPTPPFQGDAKGVFVSGKYLYVAFDGLDYAGNNAGLLFVDISDVPQPPPALVGGMCIRYSSDCPNASFPPDLRPLKVFVSGRYAYLSAIHRVTQTPYLLVIDAASIAAPTLLRTITLPFRADDVAVAGRNVYIAGVDGASGRFARIALPADLQGSADPTITDLSVSVTLPSYGKAAISLAGRYAYAVIGGDFFVFNIGNTLQIPLDIARLPRAPFFDGPAFDVAVTGTYAYVGTEADNHNTKSPLRVIDIRNPEDPRIAGGQGLRLLQENTTGAIAVGGAHVLLMARKAFGADLAIIDVPTILGLYGQDWFGTVHAANVGVLRSARGASNNRFDGLVKIRDGFAVGGSGTFGDRSLFYGETHVAKKLYAGSLSVTGQKSFLVDHPLDPRGSVLRHAAVESNMRENIYDGIAVLDENGEAVIALPAYVAALHESYRYQATPIGAPAPDLHIQAEFSGNQFVVAGGKPGMKVSWQMTGVMRGGKFPVEEKKPEAPRFDPRQ